MSYSGWYHSFMLAALHLCVKRMPSKINWKELLNMGLNERKPVFWIFNQLRSKQAYSRFRNFRENFIFANSIKRHISDVKNV